MKFNKFFANKDYEMYFNAETGLEIIRGTDGKPDPFRLALPSLLDIGIMGHCKHKCPFCYQGHVSEPNMRLEDYKSIIKQVREHTNQIALGGRGDPNHHENFKEIIMHTQSNKIVPNYTTSGIGLTDEHVEISKMCGAVAVSDYGEPYTYRAIKMFMDAGIKTNIHLIFSRDTFEKSMKILYGYDPWLYYGETTVDIDRLNAVIFLLFKSAGAGVNIDWNPKQYHIRTFAESVFNPRSKFKIGMDSCLVNHVLKYVEPNELQKMSIDTCEGARMSAYITPDMQMMPCSFAESSMWSVPIKGDKDIKYIWNRSRKFKSFRNQLRQTSNCCPLGL